MKDNDSADDDYYTTTTDIEMSSFAKILFCSILEQHKSQDFLSLHNWVNDQPRTDLLLLNHLNSEIVRI